jgi:hypothetical protein
MRLPLLMMKQLTVSSTTLSMCRSTKYAESNPPPLETQNGWVLVMDGLSVGGACTTGPLRHTQSASDH